MTDWWRETRAWSRRVIGERVTQRQMEAGPTIVNQTREGMTRGLLGVTPGTLYSVCEGWGWVAKNSVVSAHADNGALGSMRGRLGAAGW